MQKNSEPVPKSADVCSKIPILPFFPVIFQFWEGDEEFAPKIMILWDRKALDFMHFETLYYVIGLLLQRLVRLCDTQLRHVRRHLPPRLPGISGNGCLIRRLIVYAFW